MCHIPLHLTSVFPSHLPKSLYFTVNSDKQQITRKALKPTPFTLTNTHAASALQLLRHVVFHLHRSLWIQYYQIEYVGKNKLSSVTVPTVKGRVKR
jgi:hypothetical protein